MLSDQQLLLPAHFPISSSCKGWHKHSQPGPSPAAGGTSLPEIWALFQAGCCSGSHVPSLVLAACSSTDSLLVQAACGCRWWPRKRALAGSLSPDGSSANTERTLHAIHHTSPQQTPRGGYAHASIGPCIGMSTCAPPQIPSEGASAPSTCQC